MHLKYIFLTVIIYGWANIVSGQNIGSKELLQRVIESHPVLSHSTKEISKKVKKQYKKTFNTALNLSNLGVDYNKTDVVYKDEPYGMLLFLGTDIGNVGFFLFEAKGVASQCYFIYYVLEGRSVRQMKRVILEKQPHDFEELKQIIINNEYF